ncbi:MAG: hypothetical protein KDC87_08780, partial [Planctomycetes bacterium]|nr:hypothetical protein [Planctomycetota bacterium]
PPRTIERAVAYVRASQTRRGRAKGLFYYKIHGRGAYQKNTQFSINAAALTALISAGVYEQELMSPALGFLAEEAVAVQDYSPQHFFYWYGNYYACQALFHGDGLLPGTAFRDYYVRTRTHLVAQQRDDGRWENDVGPGDTFATAVACVVLQVPTQLLPIFQR